MDSAHESLLSILEGRFDANPHRHEGLRWPEIEARLDQPFLEALVRMEGTGGEPDVVLFGGEPNFVDCAPESPVGRRSLCFDRKAWDSRKANKPEGSAVEWAESMGVRLLTEAQYRHLQTLGEFDLKTSSWIETPPDVRALGGALFCDRRYDRVFTFHNGADSYYASRGFRAKVEIAR